MNSKEEKILQEIIQQEFDTRELPESESSFTALRQVLISKVAFLLDHDFEKMIQILYRIDVSEEKVKKTFEAASGPDLPEILADLIIERQIEKSRTRNQFPKENGWKE